MLFKKIGIILLTFLFITACSSSNNSNTLFLLNWGDYIDEDLVNKFEKENNVEVVMVDAESNESMYEQIKMNRTSFDIAIPSDYMIDQLDHENLIKEIDHSRLKNFNASNVYDITKKYGPDFNKYIPYFNGTLGIMYSNKNIKNIEQVIKDNGWKVLFDNSLLPNAKIGMYSSSRDAFAAALLSLDYSINTTNDKELKQAFNLLKDTSYNTYGDDNLKKNIVMGNLDLALVYSGDFYEELIVANEEDNDVNFSFYAPDNNNYWIDGMVIPKNSKNTELAYKFIDFMLNPDNNLDNALYVGYPVPYKSVMDLMKQDKEVDYLTSNPYYNPALIPHLKPQTFKFLGFDYMVKLEELFAESKTD